MVVFLRKANVAAASPSQQSSLRILRITPGNIGYILKNLLLDQFGKKAPIGNTVKYATEQHKQSGSRLQLARNSIDAFPQLSFMPPFPYCPNDNIR